MENGYTVSPVPTEDAAGNISYHFDVQNNSYVSEGNEIINEDDAYYEDEQGNHHHILENVDFERFERFDEDYVSELTEDDFDSGITNEDLSSIVADYGPEQFVAMNSWAQKNLNQQAQQRIQSVLASGDVPAIQDIYSKLHMFYQENTNNDFASEERVTQPTNTDQQITDNLQSIAGGRGNYNQLLEMARETFSDEQIDRYNQVMQDGTYEQRALAVRWLSNKFSN